jgi:hypothetical protein
MAVTMGNAVFWDVPFPVNITVLETIKFFFLILFSKFTICT